MLFGKVVTRHMIATYKLLQEELIVSLFFSLFIIFGLTINDGFFCPYHFKCGKVNLDRKFLKILEISRHSNIN